MEEFIRLLGQSQRLLSTYLMTLLRDRNVVDDVLQETNLVIWREYQSFRIGTSFTAWSCRIAYNQMLAWRKKQQRDRLQFSDTLLQAIALELDDRSDYYKQRMDALEDCLQRLPQHQRMLIQLRYTSGDAIESIAKQLNRSADAVYRALSRIRFGLRDCISRTIASTSTDML